MIEVIISLLAFCLIYQSKFLNTILDTILSKYQWGFRKGHGTKHCLIALLEKWQVIIDWGLEFGILLTDLSKTFDCLTHDLFIAKLRL